MSVDEILVAIQIGLVDGSEEEFDTDPFVRRICPSGTWGAYKQGLRHAQPFDGLVGA